MIRDRGAERAFGGVWISYVAEPDGAAATRLLAKLRVAPGRGLLGFVQRRLLPWGDLVMARRQLLNLRDLAEGRG